MGKLFLSVFLRFFADRKLHSAITAQGELVRAVTVTLKKEASALILKTSIGLIASGLLIYSLINLGMLFNDFLIKYQYGTVFSVLFFIGLSAACGFLLAKLFYEKKETREESFETFFAKGNVLNVKSIYSNFVSGLEEGINQAEEPLSHKKLKIKKAKSQFEENSPSEMFH